MSQITLIEKIKKDAAATVSEIKSTGATEVESIQREIETKVAELVKTKKEALEKTKIHMELVAVSKAKQAGNIALQTAKREQIDAIFNEVADDLQKQSSEDYVSFFSKYLSEIVPKDVEIEEIHIPANREEETEKIMKGLGLSGKVKAEPYIKAGVVVHAQDGVYDVTLGRLMNEKRADLEMVVVNQVMK